MNWLRKARNLASSSGLLPHELATSKIPGGQPVAQQAIDKIMSHPDMPRGYEMLADLVARHAASLVAPITDARGKVDPDLLRLHIAVLEWVYPRAAALFTDAGDAWCFDAIVDASGDLMSGIVLDNVHARFPAVLDIINASIEVTRL